MKLLKNRRFAWLITYFLIFLSIIIGGARSLYQLQEKVEYKYENGISDKGYGIPYYLTARIDNSINLVTVANRWIPGDKAVEAVIAARNQLIAAKTPGEQYRANTELTTSTTALYERLGEIEMDARDLGYRQSLFVDLTSNNSAITFAGEEYNLEADKFNSVLKKFPASLIRIVTNIKMAELYE